MANSVLLLADGFNGVMKLTRLLQGALEDLLSDKSVDHQKMCQAQFYLSLPNPKRLNFGYALNEDENTRNARRHEILSALKSTADMKIANNIVMNACRLANWPCTPKLAFVAVSGNTGVAEALVKAFIDLEKRITQVAIVGGVDSFLDEETLYWLENTGILKTPKNPVGVSPGEGCSLLMLESEKNDTNNVSPNFGTIREVALADDTVALCLDAVPSGLGVENAIVDLVIQEQADGTSPLWIITDQNGETQRATEWGNTVVRLKDRFPYIDNPLVWYPTIPFGDTGAAYGSIAICMVTCAFERKICTCSRCHRFTVFGWFFAICNTNSSS